jgi:hypothetical protein
MKIINGDPENINRIKFDIAKKVFNDWNTKLDIVTKLELVDFTSNVITFISKLPDLKKELFEEMVAIPYMCPEIYQEVKVLCLVFKRNEKGWQFDKEDSKFTYWDISYKLQRWFDTGEKNPGEVFDTYYMCCRDYTIKQWTKEFYDRMKCNFIAFRKGLGIIYNSDLDENLKAIKELNDKLKALREEHNKLEKRGKNLIQKICSMSEDF